MKPRHLPGLSKPRVQPSGAGARELLAERMRDVRIVEEGERADYLLIKAEDLEDIIEDALAAAAYNRTRDEESVPISLVDRLLNGENPVKVWREYRGLTLAELAQKASISEHHLSLIENGDRRGAVAVLAKLAAVLAIDIDDLIPT